MAITIGIRHFKGSSEKMKVSIMPTRELALERETALEDITYSQKWKFER